MKDIMVDLETMDLVPSAAIVAIGAVHCDLITGETSDTYYRVVDLESQDAMGMTLNSEVIYWWMQQSDAAREAITITNKMGIGEMCEDFKHWLLSIDPSEQKLRLWGNGAAFDNAILRYVFRQCGSDLPIMFWNDRDMRTILGFYPRKLQELWRQNNRRKGDHHNALGDAQHQVKYCSYILQELGVKELY